MKMKTALFALFLCLCPNALFALDTGLEMGGAKNICLVVEDVGGHAHNIGFSVDFIRAKVQSHLRKSGLQHSKDCGQDGYLYVNLQVLKDAYAIKIQFKRIVNYHLDSRVSSVLGSVWEINGMGHHGGVGDFVVSHILDKLDIFIAAYLKANNL